MLARWKPLTISDCAWYQVMNGEHTGLDLPDDPELGLFERKTPVDKEADEGEEHHDKCQSQGGDV